MLEAREVFALRVLYFNLLKTSGSYMYNLCYIQ
jgi:hypothetical protein